MEHCIYICNCLCDVNTNSCRGRTQVITSTEELTNTLNWNVRAFKAYFRYARDTGSENAMNFDFLTVAKTHILSLWIRDSGRINLKSDRFQKTWIHVSYFDKYRMVSWTSGNLMKIIFVFSIFFPQQNKYWIVTKCRSIKFCYFVKYALAAFEGNNV